MNAIIEYENQNKIKRNLDQSLLNLCGTIADRRFFKIKRNLKTLEYPSQKVTAKCMEMLNNANPVGIYLSKLTKETPEQGVKYVQS